MTGIENIIKISGLKEAIMNFLKDDNNAEAQFKRIC
jgi:hypothetical protein